MSCDARVYIGNFKDWKLKKNWFAVKRKPGPAPIMKRRKELKDGEFDADSVMPWKLDFNTTEKEATFWLWEQKWRTFYNFIGNLHFFAGDLDPYSQANS